MSGRKDTGLLGERKKRKREKERKKRKIVYNIGPMRSMRCFVGPIFGAGVAGAVFRDTQFYILAAVGMLSC